MLTRAGDFGRARAATLNRATEDRTDRSFMLDRMKVLTMAMADGVPEAARPVADDLYAFLRTQGVNAQNTLPTVFFGEGASRIYKGEPFEQALTLALIATLDASEGDWGNARAAANNALFQVRDFSKTLGSDSGSAVSDRLRLLQAAPGNDARSLEQLATPQTSDFEIGYALRAIASRQLGETADMDEALTQLVKVAPRLDGLAAQIKGGNYNTVLVVDSGTGPQKIATGPDGAIAAFRRTAPQDDAPLRVSIGGAAAAQGASESFPLVTDIDRLALDLRWNNLEDLRLAKSTIGTGLLVGGTVLAGSSNDQGTQLAGLGLILAGVLSKATAAADTRHNELLPQRTHIALLTLNDAAPIHLSIEGPAPASLILTGLGPPTTRGGVVQLRYVRLPADRSAWAESGAIRYSNDRAPPTEASATTAPAADLSLPYILGGRCVRTPNEQVLSDYQGAGHLSGFTLNDLLDLYKEEGIDIVGRSNDPQVGRHILEGGRFLYTPLAGTTGFARLYGEVHRAYQPKSNRVRALAEQIRGAQPRANP
ncbi:MAG: hypothetical protein ACKVS8_11375 [Phycisphaerales bacterium]